MFYLCVDRVYLLLYCLCLWTSYYRCFFHIPLSTVKPQTVDAASVTPPDSDHQIDISFDTKVCGYSRHKFLTCSGESSFKIFSCHNCISCYPAPVSLRLIDYA